MSCIFYAFCHLCLSFGEKICSENLWEFRGASFWPVQGITIGPPEFSDKSCKPPWIFFAGLQNYLWSEKGAPDFLTALFIAPLKTKKQNLCPPEFWTAKANVQSTQKQPFLTSRFRGALLTKSVTLEYSQDTGCVAVFCSLLQFAAVCGCPWLSVAVRGSP